MLHKLKGYMMPIAMTIGIILHQYVGTLSFLIPYLIFIMLLLTYIKLKWHEIKFTPLHLWLIGIQVVGSVIIYLLLNPFNPTVAQGIMICILAPTATSAPVITGMLKGNVSTLTAYSLISNLTVAIVAPIFFSYVGFHQLAFIDSFLEISKRVFILLASPFFIALAVNRYFPKTSHFLKTKGGVSFYLWSIALVIVSGKTVNFIVQQNNQKWTLIIIALGALAACIFQFWIGRRIGRKYNDTIAGGQGLGQKNTVLSIWMTQMYLNPIASIGPGAYVLWQNMINSYQVWKKRKSL